MGLPVAALKVVITNGGVDVGGQGTFEVRPAGQHNADVIAYEGSGGTVRVAAGTYDVDARFQDGSINKTVWLDGLALSGTMQKAVEVGASVADVTWHITNHGKDVGADGIYQIRPDGKHDGDVIAYESSGGTVRLPGGDYDVDIVYSKGLIKKIIWLDHQTLTGKVDKSTEPNLNPAQATVSATLNGADMGDKARIGITPAGQHDEIGDIRGGETALLEAGHYELTATMPGAEGTLHDAAIVGQAHLIVAMNALRTAELKPGGPPPKECTIEVYGVNFDFNKSVLRSDSEPVLRAVLQLFTATPSFRAEVGGHTDNIGTSDYNLKLSEARAAAVKAWLVAHSIATDRVTSRGYGDTHPLVPNDTDADRFKNRRVELRRMNCQ
jgi:outer membrane protein OmpA-like peptidoglycan-associated protein